MVKTTLYLDETTMLRLRQLSKKQGRQQSALIREALDAYLDRNDKRPMPKGVGAYSSGRSDISERAEELLDGMRGSGS